MLITNKKIAIVGGGPAGLTLARLLQISGAEVNVYERDYNREARVQGATLDLHTESGLKALDKAGLLNAFYANYQPAAGILRVVDKHARIKMDQHESHSYVEDRPEIDRGPLRNILLDSLEPGTVIWDSQFASMNPDGHSWQLTFKNGTQAYADIVIAADGANSKIRPFITPIKPFYAGITVIEGSVYNADSTTPDMNTLLKGGKIFALDDSKSIIVSSKGDGSLSYYIGLKADEHWATNSGINFQEKSQVISWFKKEFASWNSVWLEMIENSASFLPRPQYCMPLDQLWPAQSNLTMLGDAAHLMPPYAGEGVNMAMLDALELSECLTNTEFPDLQSAIAHFENQMRVRASQAAQITLDSTKMLHSENAIDKLITMFNSFENLE